MPHDAASGQETVAAMYGYHRGCQRLLVRQGLSLRRCRKYVGVETAGWSI